MLRDLLPAHWQPVYDQVRFEWRTTIGRWRSKVAPPPYAYLQVGCGDRLLKGFLNTDVFSNRAADRGVDLRFDLPFPGRCFDLPFPGRCLDGVYAHHVVEHLSHDHACRFMGEARRVLRAGGTLRIIVPDLAKFARAYCDKPDDLNHSAQLYPPWHRQDSWSTPLEVMDFAFRDSYWNPHLSSWDEHSLRLRLSEAGFDSVTVCTCGQSRDAMLSGHDNETWEAQSLYVEAYAAAS
ncbi:MAG: methyltransferase domain-containing protein [Gammaproteobacteria bacterium]|nr:methyltransferase domain-containing protein [Gammaproteobacteria bacterium]